MGNSTNNSIDRLDGLRTVYRLQGTEESVSSMRLMSVKASVLDWLEEQKLIVWSNHNTRASITEEGIKYLTEHKWIQ